MKENLLISFITFATFPETIPTLTTFWHEDLHNKFTLSTLINRTHFAIELLTFPLPSLSEPCLHLSSWPSTFSILYPFLRIQNNRLNLYDTKMLLHLQWLTYIPYSPKLKLGTCYKFWGGIKQSQSDVLWFRAPRRLYHGFYSSSVFNGLILFLLSVCPTVKNESWISFAALKLKLAAFRKELLYTYFKTNSTIFGHFL